VTVETAYTYSGGAHWARTPSALSPLKDINYADFRGFKEAATITGRAGDDSRRQKVVTEYFRGTGNTLDASVGGGVSAADNERFVGMPFSTTVYLGAADGAKKVSVSVAKHTQEITATNRGWDSRTDETADDTHARRLRSSTSWTQVLHADGTTTSSTTRARTTFDDFGQVTEVHDAGDVGTSADDLCTTTKYVPNTDTHLYTTIKETRTIAAPCGSTGRLVAAQQIAYDGGDVSAKPTRGLPTKSLMPDPDKPPAGPVGKDDALPSWVTAQRVTYESSGRARPRFVYDALVRMSETTYQDNSADVPIGMTTFSPDPDGTGPVTRFETKTVLDPFRGVPLTVTDPNGKVTTARYDSLGRLLKVWQPDRPTSKSASVEYTYTVRASGINAVRTSVLGADGTTRHESSTLYDGLLREIQTQAESADPSAKGRIVTDTRYDHAGRKVMTLGQWYVKGQASDKFLTLASRDEVAPAAVLYEYDGAGRLKEEAFYNGNVENPAYMRWKTTTRYDGKFTRVTPPDGGTPTTTVVDARGRMVELRQHTGASPSVDGPYQATTYKRDPEGRLTEVIETTTVNAEAKKTAVWKYTYDVLGRQVEADDPDRMVPNPERKAQRKTLAKLTREREKLERLARYVARPPIAGERLALTESGHVRLALKTPYRNGSTHVILEPEDFMARLAALVPKGMRAVTIQTPNVASGVAGFVIDGLEEPSFGPEHAGNAGLSWTAMPGIPPVLAVRLRV
jgi:YD repeat-containing protein